jgi:hypothetical protein
LQNRILTIADNDFGDDLMASWRDNADNVAIEITRAAYVACHFPNSPIIPPDMFSKTSSRLRQAVEQFYTSFERDLLAHLAKLTLEHVSVFQSMSTLAISETQKQYQQNRHQSDDQALPDLDNMARSLAHLAVLHWQVWRDLVYMRDESTLTLDQEEVPQVSLLIWEGDQVRAIASDAIGTQKQL